MTPTVAIINASTDLTDAEVVPVVSALQKQVDGDFAPLWGVSATLDFVPKGARPPKGAWWLSLLDNADQAGALGYHDRTSHGLPLGKCFVRTTKMDGGIWSVTLSHELLEMLGDPEINRCAEHPTLTGHFYAWEACDAVEADGLGYTIDGIHVSDFVTTAWFSPGMAGPFSFRRHVRRPLELAPGGYIGVYVPGQGWTQETRDDRHAPSQTPHPGSRRERRARGKRRWNLATVEAI
jgi:hypothetical protein